MPAGPLILRCPTPAVGRVAPRHRVLGTQLSASIPDLAGDERDRGDLRAPGGWKHTRTPGEGGRLTNASHPPRADAT